MKGFSYQNGSLFCEAVAVEKIVAQHGTPVYIYSQQAIVENYQTIFTAFNRDLSTLICYSIKSCSNLNILRLLAEHGAGFDIVSGGELFRALHAGADPQKIVFAGVAKTAAEIEFALTRNILMFNCESEQEVLIINEIARKMCKTANISLRLNPDIDAQTHAKTTTAKKENKFGVTMARAKNFLQNEIDKLKNVELRGLDLHLGSPINSVEPYARAIEKLVEFIRCAPASLTHLDLGGGFGLVYRDENTPDFAVYARTFAPLRATGKQLIIEPGRSLIGNTALLVAEVQYVKTNGEKTFYLTDTGMNDLIRPAMYDAYHFIWTINNAPPVNSPLFAENTNSFAAPQKLSAADITGPICESSDVFAKGREIPPVEHGDKIAIFSAGAYGFSMSSNYNSRPRPAEILVNGAEYRVIRQRENYADLIRGE